MSEELGRKIRNLRKTQGKSLRGLGSRTGLSATHLSEIERGHSSPTVSALARIAYALHRSPAELLQDDTDPVMTLTRPSERRTLERDEDGFSISMLSDVPQGARFRAYILEIPGGAAHRVPALEGSELACIYLLSGKAEVEIDGLTATLTEGASLQAFVNSTCSFRGDGEPAQVLAVVCQEAPSPP
jgi:transcriptional regulator with XRE-family HTH domain